MKTYRNDKRKERLRNLEALPMFTMLAAVVLLNLYCFAEFVKEAITGSKGIAQVYETMALQILLCEVLILINVPFYLRDTI